MKRAVIGAVVVAVTAIVGVVGCGSGCEPDPPRTATPAPAAPRPATQAGAEALAVGASFRIAPPPARYVHALAESERREQLRDWAVFAVLARSGPTNITTSDAQMIPARVPALEREALAYGAGRWLVADGRLLLFHDGDDPDPRVTLAHLVDRARSERIDVPAVVEVYRTEDRRDDGEILVVRMPDVARRELFSTAYGYVEGEATTAVQLADWLARADDLTFIAISDDRRVTLGGRRFPSARTSGLAVEDVAAMYQERTCGATAFAGTAIGMTAAYTAAVARAWAGDEARSAPVFDVPGFPLSRHARGATSPSIALGRRSEIAVDHGPFALPPWNVEIRVLDRTAREPATTAVRWWNQHFEQVADYEQEYHRLNQIAKWTSATAALRARKLAGYLDRVAVARDLQFEAWRTRRGTELRFSGALRAKARSTASCFPWITASDRRPQTSAVAAGHVHARRGPPGNRDPAAPARDRAHEETDEAERRSAEAARAALRAKDDQNSPTARVGQRVRRINVDADASRLRQGIGSDTVRPDEARVVYRRSGNTLSAGLTLGGKPLGELQGSVTASEVDLIWRESAAPARPAFAAGRVTTAGAAPKLAGVAALAAGRADNAQHLAIRDTLGLGPPRAGPPEPPPTSGAAGPDAIMQSAINDAAHYRPAAVLRALRQLSRAPAPLQGRATLVELITEIAWPRAARLIEHELGTTLDAARLEAFRGRIGVTRDMQDVLKRPLRPLRPDESIPSTLYVDSKLNPARESLEADPGDSVSRARKSRHLEIRIAEIDRSHGLPDRIVDSIGKIEFFELGGEKNSLEDNRAAFLSACPDVGKDKTRDDCR